MTIGEIFIIHEIWGSAHEKWKVRSKKKKKKVVDAQ